MRVLIFVLPIAAFAYACSGTNAGTGTPTPTAPSPPVQAAPPSPAPPSLPLTALVTITGAGFMPSEVSIGVGGRVTFTNADTRPQDMLGGPDHTRLDCSEVDVVGFLVPGQSRETSVLETARICEFHDHTNLGNPAFQGRITVR